MEDRRCNNGHAHAQHANRCSAERVAYNESLDREMLFVPCVACNFAYFAPFVPPIPPALHLFVRKRAM
jgi:hypothetical protein